MPVIVNAVSSEPPSAASAGRPIAKCPPAPGRTIISTPMNPTTAAPIRNGPTLSRRMKTARGTIHRARVNDNALASANGIFWKA